MLNQTKQEQPKILVVIPTYNNQGTIVQVVRSVLDMHPHVLLVNDGSTDETDKRLSEAGFFSPGGQLLYLRHQVNQGKGASLRTAFAFAQQHGFTFMVTIDADGQHDPHDLPAFTKLISDGFGGVIIGRRAMEDQNAGDVPGPSRFGRSFSNFWIAVETGLKFSDTQSGFRAYPVDQRIASKLQCHFYDFEIEILVHYIWAGYPVLEIPIQVYYPPRRQRVSHFRPVVDNLRLSILHTILVTKNILRMLKIYQPFPAPRRPSTRELGGSWIMAKILRLGGKTISWIVMPVPLFYFFIAHRSPRRAMLKYHAHLASSKRASWVAAFKNYWLFGCALLDRLSLAQIEVNSPYQQLFQPGCIYIGAHYGDWLAPSVKLAARSGAKVAIVMDQNATPKFTRLMQGNNLHGLRLIAAEQEGLTLALSLKGALDEGFSLCFMGDRYLKLHETLAGKFLGPDALFPSGPFRLAVLFHRPVYFFCCLRDSFSQRGRYHIKRELLWDGTGECHHEELLQRYITALEKQVRAAPNHWFNFFDFWETSHASS